MGTWAAPPALPPSCAAAHKARLYFGHAVNDQSMPAEAIEKLGRALASWGDEYDCESYDGAYHGWTTPGVPVYKEKRARPRFRQAQRAVQADVEMTPLMRGRGAATYPESRRSVCYRGRSPDHSR